MGCSTANDHVLIDKARLENLPRSPGISRCGYPWHNALVANDGKVLPCGHGSSAVGDLNEESFEKIWNGSQMRELRYCVKNGLVHPVCASKQCPFQTEQVGFKAPVSELSFDEAEAARFDEHHYLETHRDVRVAVRQKQLTSGLEHYVRFGRSEGREYRIQKASLSNRLLVTVNRFLGRSEMPYKIENPVLALIEQSRGRLEVRNEPVDLVVAVSNLCNLSCVMCPHGIGIVENRDHLKLTYVRRIEKVVKSSRRVILSGIGEPLGAPAFWEMLNLLEKGSNQFSRVNSNGLLVNEERARRILNSGLCEVSFSLDAASESTYRRIRGAELSKALRGVRLMIEERKKNPESRLEIYVNMTLMMENHAEVEDFVRLGKRIGADGVILSQLFGFGDRPDWIVEKPDWKFRYSEQMLTTDEPLLRRTVARAMSAANEEGIKLILLSDLGRYGESS